MARKGGRHPGSPQRSGQLWAALCLTALPVEALTRGVAEPGPTVIVEEVARSPMVCACTKAAQQVGVRVGMSLSAAMAVAGELDSLPRDAKVEGEVLEGLAGWAYQFTSMVCAIDTEPRGFLLEIGGSLGLFGNDPHALGKQLRDELLGLGFSAWVAVAPTPTAALWLARSGIQTLIQGQRSLERRIASLPVTVMDLEPSVLQALREIGVQTIEALMRLPRAETARRLGPGLHHQIDSALGRVSDPRKPLPFEERAHRSVSLPVPVGDVEMLLFALGRILRELLGVLSATGKAVQMITLVLAHADRTHSSLSVRLISPSREQRHIMELLRYRLRQLTISEPVESLTLELGENVELAPRNGDLFDDGGVSGRRQSDDEFLAVLERLNARLGDDRVKSIREVGDHRPEYAWQAVGPVDKSERHRQAKAAPVPRPLWLLDSPQRLHLIHGCPEYRGLLRLDSTAERIESGWWDVEDTRRDYHVAVNTAGERFWVFRDRNARESWYLHGIFA